MIHFYGVAFGKLKAMSVRNYLLITSVYEYKHLDFNNNGDKKINDINRNNNDNIFRSNHD